ncbi:IclR family transcriptional regulator [Actinomadura rugatobispora]|uniref:IclR family transcriptional regulator n=1 Tax=Actinomadura rugatobispora TaxID=1994 RepID=A0ABW1A4W3_9ACTN|nr:IclR family transcriptional regulator [Actinomadura rugatobispora]
MAEGSIARTLRVLEAVCDHGPQTLKALSERTELAPPTLLRILRLMADEGYVVQQADRTWRGTMLVWRLGCAVNTSVGLLAISREHTDRLTAELDETSVYAVYEQGAVTYAAHSEPIKPVRAHVRLGQRYRLLAVTTGQAVLAQLDEPYVERALAEQTASGDPRDPAQVETMLAEIRRRGYAAGPGVRWPELWGCAAPVFDATGGVVGALGVSIPTARAEEISDQVVAGVLKEAEAMSVRLGRPAIVREV